MKVFKNVYQYFDYHVWHMIYVTGCTVSSKEAADVTKRKPDHLSKRAKTLKQGPIDAFTVIHESGWARNKPWEEQVEEAVKGESDEFWRKVSV